MERMPQIRRARPDEARVLSDLALRSKGYWGYDPSFLEACREALTISPEEVRDTPMFVLDEEGQIAGFSGLAGEPPEGTLEYLFLDPERIGKGYGKLLWRHAVDTARELGFEQLMIESEPNAEAFYQAMGAEPSGAIESTVQPGRFLPLLRLKLRP